MWSRFCRNYVICINKINLATPGDLLFEGNYQLYNVIITAYVLLMNFFIVMNENQIINNFNLFIKEINFNKKINK